MIASLAIANAVALAEGNGNTVVGDNFKLGEPKFLAPKASLHGSEVARGDYWSVYLHEGRYVLRYISGELSGRENDLAITAEQAAALVNETGNVEEILLAQGAG